MSYNNQEEMSRLDRWLNQNFKFPLELMDATKLITAVWLILYYYLLGRRIPTLVQGPDSGSKQIYSNTARPVIGWVPLSGSLSSLGLKYLIQTMGIIMVLMWMVETNMKKNNPQITVSLYLSTYLSSIQVVSLFKNTHTLYNNFQISQSNPT